MAKAKSGLLDLDHFLERYNKDKGEQPKNINTRGGRSRPLVGRPSVALARSRLNLVRGAKPAIIKLTSRGQGAAYAIRAVSYISRGDDDTKDTIKIEDEYGQEHEGDADSVRDLVDTWRPYIRDRANATSAVHYMVSTPWGTDPETAMDAAREFFKTTFPDHKYFLALHTDTDYHHVHAVVCYQSTKMELMRTSRPDLQRYREGWAACLNDRGLNVHAEPRWKVAAEKGAPNKAYYPNSDGRNTSSVDSRQTGEKGWAITQQRAWIRSIIDFEQLRDSLSKQSGSKPLTDSIDQHVKNIEQELESQHGFDKSKLDRFRREQSPTRDRNGPDRTR